MKYLLFVFFILFLGCSNKINPAEYHKVYAQKSKYLPSPQEINAKPKVLILEINSNDYDAINLLPLLKEKLQNLISNTSAILLQRNKKTSLKEEIIYAQESKLSDSNINSADYVIFATITNTYYNYTYHRGIKWVDKKGRVHYQPPYYSYKACVNGEIKVIKIPQNYIAKQFHFGSCAYATTRYRSNLKQRLLQEALIDALDDLQTDFKELFAKKGYVIEVRKKDDETIIKTTLGSEDGIKEGDIVNVYTIKEYNNPITNKKEKEIKLIAKGEVSNVVNQNTSWIIIEKSKEPIKIGDFIKPKFDTGFFERIFE